MVVVRPGTIGPAPGRAGTQWKAAGDGFFVSRCKAEGGGKKLAAGVAGRRARRSRSSVRPNPFEDAVGVADREIRGTRHWWRSTSAPDMKRWRTSGRANLTPDRQWQGAAIVCGDTGASRSSPRSPRRHWQAGDDCPPSNVTSPPNWRSGSPRARPGRRCLRRERRYRRHRPATATENRHLQTTFHLSEASSEEEPSTADLRVSDRSRMAETRLRRGSGAAESAAPEGNAAIFRQSKTRLT